MFIYVICVDHPSYETPWVVGAWDEWTVDENPAGLDDAIMSAKSNHPGHTVRTAKVEVPDTFFETVFNTFFETVFSPAVVPGKLKSAQ